MEDSRPAVDAEAIQDAISRLEAAADELERGPARASSLRSALLLRSWHGYLTAECLKPWLAHEEKEVRAVAFQFLGRLSR